MRLDIPDLRLFLCVVEAGSITQGAQRAHLALASASERLRSIEEDAGVALLVRRARGVVPTEAGEALAHHARLILQQQALLRGELRDFASGARGTLQLYAGTAALTEFLPRKLASWLARRPRLHIELKERTSTEIARHVGAGLMEAGIVSDATDVQGLGVHLQPVARNHLVLIVAQGHALAARRSVRFVEVLDAPFVGLAPGSALQDHIDSHAQAAGHTLNFRIRMKTFEGLCEMVSHGVGLAIVPQTVARRERRRHAYRTVVLDEAWAQRQLCVCFRDWNALSAPMQNLLAYLGASRPQDHAVHVPEGRAL